MKLYIWSAYRSGACMVRSMLRNDPRVADRGFTIGNEISLTDTSPVDMLNIKYGIPKGFPVLLERLNRTTDARVLVLHRRDVVAQEVSIAYAVANGGSWHHAPTTQNKGVIPVGKAVRRVQRNRDQLENILRDIRVPHRVLTYEDITTQSVKVAMDDLFPEINLAVGEPTTIKAVHDICDAATNHHELHRVLTTFGLMDTGCTP